MRLPARQLPLLLLPWLVGCYAGMMGHLDIREAPEVTGASGPPARMLTGSVPAHVPDAGAARIVVVGDTGKREGDAPAASTAQVAADAASRCEALGGCQGVFLLGDNVYETGIAPAGSPDNARAVTFLDAQAGLWEGMGPQLYVVGNHDWGASGFSLASQSRIFRMLDAMAALASKRPDVHGAWMFYTARIGPVHIVALDTWYLANKCRAWKAPGSPGWTCEARGSKGTGLDAWLKQALVKPADTPWQVIVGHVGWLSRGGHGDLGRASPVELPARGAGLLAFIDAEVRGEADAWLAGHDHHLELFASDARLAGTAAVISGAGAKARPVRNVPSGNKAAGLPTSDWDSVHGTAPPTTKGARAKAESPLGYFLLEADGTSLRLTPRTVDGAAAPTAVKCAASRTAGAPNGAWALAQPSAADPCAGP